MEKELTARLQKAAGAFNSLCPLPHLEQQTETSGATLRSEYTKQLSLASFVIVVKYFRVPLIPYLCYLPVTYLPGLISL